jgi:hypothetical protein
MVTIYGRKKALILLGLSWFRAIRFTVTLGKPVTIATAGIGPRGRRIAQRAMP